MPSVPSAYVHAPITTKTTSNGPGGYRLLRFEPGVAPQTQTLLVSHFFNVSATPPQGRATRQRRFGGLSSTPMPFTLVVLTSACGSQGASSCSRRGVADPEAPSSPGSSALSPRTAGVAQELRRVPGALVTSPSPSKTLVPRSEGRGAEHSSSPPGGGRAPPAPPCCVPVGVPLRLRGGRPQRPRRPQRGSGTPGAAAAVERG